MDDTPQPVHHPGAVEVDARRLFMGERVKAGALAEGFHSTRASVAANRLKERMTGGDPL